MTAEERQRVISEDYADLLIEYNLDPTVFNAFPNATVNIINDLYAVVHIPIEEFTNLTIFELGDYAVPSLFGLISQGSIEASGIRRLRSNPNLNLRGQGVLIGIVDSGIDYTNPIFQYADGTSKIVSIWDQTLDSENAPSIGKYGTEFSREQINEALQSENPLELVPSRDEIGHGTMLAGIAAGNDVPESNFFGVAPDSEIVVVKLKRAKQYLKKFYQVPEEANAYQTNDIFFGFLYLLSVAERLQRPIAICIALGTSQGAHDGRGVLSNNLSLYANTPGSAMIVAAGNEGNARRHYFGTVDPTKGYDTVELNIGEGESGFSMELWGQAPSIFSIDILTPSGEYVPRIVARLDEQREVTFIFEQTIIYIDYQMVEAQSGDQLILMRFVNPSPGIWRFNVYERGDLQLGFHIWLPMGNFITENTFFIRSDPYTTILALGNAENPLTVTAYNYTDNSLYSNASRGFTRLGRVKPEVAAPGVGVIGPTLDQGFAEFTGTSVAAAHTAGIAAMLLEWGVVRGNIPRMSTVEIKKLLIRGARRESGITYPNRDWGYGMIDIFNTFDIISRGLTT